MNVNVDWVDGHANEVDSQTGKIIFDIEDGVLSWYWIVLERVIGVLEL